MSVNHCKDTPARVAIRVPLRSCGRRARVGEAWAGPGMTTGQGRAPQGRVGGGNGQSRRRGCCSCCDHNWNVSGLSVGQTLCLGRDGARRAGGAGRERSRTAPIRPRIVRAAGQPPNLRHRQRTITTRNQRNLRARLAAKVTRDHQPPGQPL